MDPFTVKEVFPILEYDSAPEAIIEPTHLIRRQDVPKHAVICFFAETIEKVVAQTNARIIFTSQSEMGDHPIYEMEHKGQRLAFYHPGVGAPLAVDLTEEVIALYPVWGTLGVENFIVCGGCGVLDRKITVGHILLPVAAMRDEGTSYHYAAPSREISVDADVIGMMESILNFHNIPYIKTKTWTTDAFYRETTAKVKQFLAEGCLTVEMEAAALIALAKFRGCPIWSVPLWW